MENFNINKYLDEQEQLANALRTYASATNTDKLSEDNQKLQLIITQLQTEKVQLEAQLKNAVQKQLAYKLSFHELLMDEKLTRLKQNQKRLDLLIHQNTQQMLHGVAQLNFTVEQNIKQLEQNLASEYLDLTDQSAKNITDLITQTRNRIEEQKDFISKQEQVLLEDNMQHHATLEKLPIPEHILNFESNRVKTETRVGLKAFNYLGIIFIFLAVISLGTLTVGYFSDIMKAIAIFVLPFLLLTTGSFLYNKGKETFAYGLIGGAIGLFYIAIFVNFFVLEVFSSIAAIVLLIMVSAISIALARIYKNYTIAMLALIGGYIPIISLWYITGFDNISILIAQLYLITLNIFILQLYTRFKWQSLYLASMYLMIPWLFIFPLFDLHSIWLDFAYALFFAIVYSGIPLYRTLYQKQETTNILLYNSLIPILTFSLFGLSILPHTDVSKIGAGFILVTNLGIYAGLTKILLSAQVSKNKKPLQYITFILSTIYLFVIATYYIPVTILENFRYIPYGLAALTILYSYANYSLKNKTAQYTALIHLAVYTIITIIVNIFYQDVSFIQNSLFAIILLATAYVHNKFEVMQTRTSYLTPILNVAAYLVLNWYILISYRKLADLLTIYIPMSYQDWGLYITLVLTTLVARKYAIFQKYYLPSIASILLGLLLVRLNILRIYQFNYTLIAALMLIANGSYLVLMLAEIKTALERKYINLSLATIIFTVFIMLNSTSIAYININFAYLNVLIDIAYGGLAIFYILFGFKKNLPLIRHIGLGLMIATMAKFLFFDIPVVTLFSRMITFFIFGVLSLFISYTYQNKVNQSKQIQESQTTLSDEL